MAEESDEEEEYTGSMSRVTSLSKSYTVEEEKAIVRKFDRRLVLFMALLYMLSFLDRSSQTLKLSSISIILFPAPPYQLAFSTNADMPLLPRYWKCAHSWT
jgi:hypothetical protein